MDCSFSRQAGQALRRLDCPLPIISRPDDSLAYYPPKELDLISLLKVYPLYWSRQENFSTIFAKRFQYG